MKYLVMPDGSRIGMTKIFTPDSWKTSYNNQITIVELGDNITHLNPPPTSSSVIVKYTYPNNAYWEYSRNIINRTQTYAGGSIKKQGDSSGTGYFYQLIQMADNDASAVTLLCYDQKEILYMLTLKNSDFGKSQIEKLYYSASTPTATLSTITNAFGPEYLIDISGPIWEDDNSESGGGDGSYDLTSDTVSVPMLPTVTPATTSNLITMYNPTLSELGEIGKLMLSDTISAALKNAFVDPISAIISLSLNPFTPNISGTKSEWTIGLVGTGISMNKITNQYIEFDFGDIEIHEFWGNALDYSPYTKIELFLPYIGVQSIDTDDVMGGTVNLKYHVDMLTGTIVAFLTVVRDGFSNVLYQWTGNCASTIPVTGTDYNSLISNIINLGSSVATTVATGGLSSAVTGAMVTSTAFQAANAVTGSKPNIKKGGQAGSVAGALNMQESYLIITRPIQSLPKDFNTLNGYPSNITETLGNLEGYTEVEYVHVEGISATEEELMDIESKLIGGVIL